MNAGYTAGFVGNVLTITDTTGNGHLTVGDSGTLLPTMNYVDNTPTTNANNAAYTAVTGATNQQLMLAANTASTVGTMTAATTRASTVQDLLNAINNNTTVGAKATIVNGQVVVTDPQNREDLTVSTTDAVLGATVNGATTAFSTPTQGTTSPIRTNWWVRRGV